MQEPEATPAPTPMPQSAADLYFVPAVIGITVAIVVVGIAMVLLLRKRLYSCRAQQSSSLPFFSGLQSVKENREIKERLSGLWGCSRWLSFHRDCSLFFLLSSDVQSPSKLPSTFLPYLENTIFQPGPSKWINQRVTILLVG
jgi:hypothetical protein